VGNGEVIWTGVVLDITEQWRTEEAKQRMERDIMELQKLESLGTLAGGMAHDFNNILTAVQGYAELALHELEDGSPLRGHMEAILEASARATQISRQMLAYSGRGRLLLEPVDLAAMARECADAIRHSADDGIRIAMLSKPVPVMVEADAVQIRQSLINLRNASSSRFSRRNSPGGDLDCPRCLGLSARTMVRSG
jgi:signal transduction histidine kinase